jgi:hypothetical protein
VSLLSSVDPVVENWLAALERRHLAELEFAEVTRALRALSSCYVERRGRLAAGGALDTRGKRAAFALFYGPLHFFVTRHIVRALSTAARQIGHVTDLGCGSGTAGAAWALESGAARVAGTDRSAWAVNEANWTYRQMGLKGRAVQGDATRSTLNGHAGRGILLAYVVNELQEAKRAEARAKLMTAAASGAHVLVIEPISRRIAPWWSEWEVAFASVGGRADEWRFPSDLPVRQQALARAAGLDPRELTARSLWI